MALLKGPAKQRGPKPLAGGSHSREPDFTPSSPVAPALGRAGHSASPALGLAVRIPGCHMGQTWFEGTPPGRSSDVNLRPGWPSEQLLGLCSPVLDTDHPGLSPGHVQSTLGPTNQP